MEKKLLIIISVVFALSCKQPSSESTISNENEVMVPAALAEFVSLDQAYIPVLFFTSVENLDASRASYKELTKEWDDFQSASNQIFDDPAWVSGQIEIDQHIKEAATFITSGKDLKEAHESLEHVREILMDARHRHNIDYFVDYLTAYHEPMEQIVLTAKQTPPDQWTPETTSKIKTTVPEAETLWRAVQKAAFDPAAYGFNEQRYQKMKQFMAAETKALETLKKSLEAETPVAQLRKKAMGIKPNFAGLFKLFGNLEAYQ
jgi:hypothetical protein